MRRFVLFAAIGLAAYLATLVATIPAAIVVTPATGLAGATGTVWRGAALLPEGNRVEWNWAPLRTLANLAFALDWTAAGPRTSLGGQALLSAERIVLSDVAGQMDGALLIALAPEIGSTRCAIVMQVELARVAIGGGADQGAVGEIRSDAGSCAAPGLPAIAVPPMIATAERDARLGTRLTLTPLGQRRLALAAGSFSREGRVRTALTPEGLTALPFLASNGVASYVGDF